MQRHPVQVFKRCKASMLQTRVSICSFWPRSSPARAPLTPSPTSANPRICIALAPSAMTCSRQTHNRKCCASSSPASRELETFDSTASAMTCGRHTHDVATAIRRACRSRVTHPRLCAPSTSGSVEKMWPSRWRDAKTATAMQLLVNSVSTVTATAAMRAASGRAPPSALLTLVLAAPACHSTCNPSGWRFEPILV